MTNHTPTPWAVGPKKLQDVLIVNSAGTQYIAATFGHNYGEDNAAFIVRSVNAHDALIEALELARDCITSCAGWAHKDAQSGEGIPVEVFIDKALKLAKGEAPGASQ